MSKEMVDSYLLLVCFFFFFQMNTSSGSHILPFPLFLHPPLSTPSCFLLPCVVGYLVSFVLQNEFVV